MLYLCSRKKFRIYKMATAILKSKAVSATKMQRENTAEEPIKWTAKLQKAFDEKEFYVIDTNNFWRE